MPKEAANQNPPDPDAIAYTELCNAVLQEQAGEGILRRPLRLPPAAYATATAFLSDTLDWLNLWHHHDATGGGQPGVDSDAARNRMSARDWLI